MPGRGVDDGTISNDLVRVVYKNVVLAQALFPFVHYGFRYKGSGSTDIADIKNRPLC